ncbi:Protein of unknown function, partial [Gryllus bimaculatus]
HIDLAALCGGAGARAHVHSDATQPLRLLAWRQTGSLRLRDVHLCF